MSHTTFKKEYEANVFALDLLIPIDDLLERFGNRKIDVSDTREVVKLAKEYKVPTMIMAFQIWRAYEHRAEKNPEGWFESEKY